MEPFHSTRIDPTVPIIDEALRYCKWAYSLAPDVQCELIERDNAQAVFHRIGNQVAIGIAGTNDVEDIINAAQFCGTRNRHRGFYLHSLRMKKVLEKRISRQDHVYIYGHSLGGITAQLLSLDMVGFCRYMTVVSIGAPKGFRKPFVIPNKYMTWTILENDLDMIPDFPLLKKFDWNRMTDINFVNLFTHVHRWRLSNDTTKRPLSFSQRSVKLLRESMSLSPISTLYENIAKYHSLNHYERLINAKS